MKLPREFFIQKLCVLRIVSKSIIKMPMLHKHCSSFHENEDQSELLLRRILFIYIYLCCLKIEGGEGESRMEVAGKRMYLRRQGERSLFYSCYSH